MKNNILKTIFLIAFIISSASHISAQNKVVKKGNKTIAKDTIRTATITGDISYPACGLPLDYCVGAYNIETGERFETVKSDIIYGKGPIPTFRLKVRPGQYYVYAYSKSEPVDSPGEKAYFTTCVLGGHGGNCPGIKNMKLVVGVGEDDVKKGINPNDWYSSDEDRARMQREQPEK
jgi:hypothetical protein